MKWLQQYLDRLHGARAQGRLPHALLISGQDGVGKRELAEQLAHSLLCVQPDADGRPCDCCAACGWLQAGTHPDLLWLLPEEGGKAIKVDQVRALIGELHMTSHAGRYKMAIVQPADAMNKNAANSLLKTLEEPTDNTLLVLLTSQPGRLPATIRSRCQQLQVALPETATAQQWLQQETGMAAGQAMRYLNLANGAPLKAKQLADTDAAETRDQRLQQLVAVFHGSLDPVDIASQWLNEREGQTLEWWRAWLQDLIRWRQAGQPPPESDVAQKLQQIVETVDCRQLFDLLDKLCNALNNLDSGLNRQLILEDLLIVWAKLADLASYTNKVRSG